MLTGTPATVLMHYHLNRKMEHDGRLLDLLQKHAYVNILIASKVALVLFSQNGDRLCWRFPVLPD